MGHFSISLSPMRDEQNAVNSVVVVMTDITDATLLQAKLAHCEKMATIGRLVSGVAHEVNNPLAAILGFTDLLLENPRLPALGARGFADYFAGDAAHQGHRAGSAEFCAAAPGAARTGAA